MSSKHHLDKLSLAGVLITLGIVFGDIGTSPLYVIKAIVGTDEISKILIYGAVSCVFWTLTIITTFKYVYHAMNADNKGEGGIFALYALIRKSKVKWVIIPALLGCASLIADGFLTPSISISSAVEGLQLLYPSLESGNTIVGIVIGILILLFTFQQVGTQVVGKTFAPIMVVWFSMLAILGVKEIAQFPEIFHALNPYYAISLLIKYPGGFWLLGAVFLCSTGAEALYSDLGHCGKQNIRASWTFVFICLIINYMGQGAYLLHNFEGQVFPASSSFYALMPGWFLPYGIMIATLSTVIASQALITGTFTLVNEAMKLKLWINMKVNYPTQMRGQIYIPGINWMLLIGCIMVVLIFKRSTNMEAAYGVAIIVNMLMTTALLLFYKKIKGEAMWKIVLLGIVFLSVELAFFASSMMKFTHGGWFSLLIAAVIFILAYSFFLAKQIRQNHTEFVPLEDYVDVLEDLQKDESIAKESTNLVYLTISPNRKRIDSNIIYSILRKKPKRADIYWFVHVDILDDPFASRYSVDTISPGKIFFVRLQFGFKIDHKVNLMFYKVVEEMVASGEVDEMSHYPSLRKHNLPADFKFILLNSRISVDNEISPINQWIIRVYRILKKMSLPTENDFGLEISNVEVETVPINIGPRKLIKLKRED